MAREVEPVKVQSMVALVQLGEVHLVQEEVQDDPQHELVAQVEVSASQRSNLKNKISHLCLQHVLF